MAFSKVKGTKPLIWQIQSRLKFNDTTWSPVMKIQSAVNKNRGHTKTNKQMNSYTQGPTSHAI